MSKPHCYLLEIGTEELPVEFLLSAPGELADKIKATLEEQAIAYDNVRVLTTPRRITLIVEGLPQKQADREATTKGPPVRVALDAEGKPTQAGLGFARKVGVDFSDLKQETIDGETYMVLHQSIHGRPVKDILPEVLPDLVLGLSGSHFMAWGDYAVRFSRPIRWLLSLWDSDHLPLCIGPVASTTFTYGHRVLSEGPIEIRNVNEYAGKLERDGAVMVDQCRRREAIWEMLQSSAGEVDGVVLENPSLLDTVSLLVEHPSIVIGRFEERFLEIPEEVTTTVMTAHQKYFPVREASGKLMPYFLAVSNGRPPAAEIIQHGNEKVITARLEDARFFFAEDQKIPLENRLESLKGITFQKGLGSLYEKTERLEKLSGRIADALHYEAAEKNHTLRAARLSKADLVTGMVFEFTELQGSMGRKYALISGEPAPVAEAIYEHYLPRFTGDEVARGPVGIAVSLADKIDTIVAVFSQQNAKLPSGSKDPLGLRRMASGIIQTVLENRLTLDLLAMMRASYQLLKASLPEVKTFVDEESTIKLVNEFVLQRLRGMLLEQNIRYDIIDAVFESGQPPLADLQDVMVRLDLLRALTARPDDLRRIYEPANRIYKILGEHYNPKASGSHVEADRFRDPSEAALFKQTQTLPAEMANRSRASYDELLQVLLDLNPAVEAFFEKVMVNDPDEAVRKNRYNLLSVLNRVYLQVACFSKLQV